MEPNEKTISENPDADEAATAVEGTDDDSDDVHVEWAGYI